MAQLCVVLLAAVVLIPLILDDALGGLLHLGALLFAVYFGVSIFGSKRGPTAKKRR